MKKLLLLFLLLFTLTACSPENTGTPTPTQYFYDLTFRENISYDLENGSPIYTDYMSTARQKISRGGLFIRNTDLSPDVNAHHVLFWSKNNYYLGYQNFPSTNYEGERYLGDISTIEITLPEHADKFSIVASKMSVSELIPHEATINSNVGNLNISYTELFSTVGDEQLITNGDFSDGTTGWRDSISNSHTISVVNGILEVTRTTSGGTAIGVLRDLNFTSGKYYLVGSFKASTPFNLVPDTYLYLSSTAGQGSSATISTSWQLLSVIRQPTVNGTTFYAIQSVSTIPLNETLYIDNFMMFNISTLITNKQYSPLYDTTFDLMSDAQIKNQMDDWISDDYLPSLAQIEYETNLTKEQVLHHYHTYLRLLEKTDVTLEELYLEPDYELPSSSIPSLAYTTIFPPERTSVGLPNRETPKYSTNLLDEKPYVLIFEYYQELPRIDGVNEYIDIYDEVNNLLYDNVGIYSLGSADLSFLLTTSHVTNDPVNEMINVSFPVYMADIIEDENQISNIPGLNYLNDPINNMDQVGFEIYMSGGNKFYSINLPYLGNSYLDLGIVSTDTFSEIKTKFIDWVEQSGVELKYRLVPKIYDLKGLIHINEQSYELKEGENSFAITYNDDVYIELNSGQPNWIINDGVYDIFELDNTGILNYPNYTYLSLEDKSIFIEYWGGLEFEYLSQVSLLNSTYEYVSANIDDWISRYELIDSYTEFDYTEFQDTVAYYILDVYPPTPSNTSGFLNDQLEEWGLNTTLFKTLMIVLFMIVTSIILAIFGAKQSILILANTLLLILFAILGWVSMWLFIPIVLIAGTFIILKFTNSGGGTEV